MTKAQEITIQRIRRYIEQNDLYKNDPSYEFKEFTVEETDYGTVIVYSVTGRKGDEGTLAAVLARNTRRIFIGKRGGLRCQKWDAKRKKTTDLTGWSNVMIYGYSH